MTCRPETATYNQKTGGLRRSLEKNTALSRPEGKFGIFCGERMRAMHRVATVTFSMLKYGIMMKFRKIGSCFSGEKVKSSLNWILLAKSSQQHFSSKCKAFRWSAYSLVSMWRWGWF